MDKTFSINKNGKIELSQDELNNLLNEVYNDGYKNGKNSNVYVWHSPNHWWDTITYTADTPISYDTTKITVGDYNTNTILSDYCTTSNTNVTSTLSNDLKPND